MKHPVALTIAGSDCSAGAGLQADLKTFSSFGVHGLTAVTCVVSETPLTVSCVHPIPPAILRDQISLMLSSYPISAIKTGMLYSKSHIIAICELLEDVDIPIIVDPVMVASTGDPLLLDDALEAISSRLLPLATVMTPNLPEASVLLARPISTADEQKQAAIELSLKYGAACYLKGGHLVEKNQHRDILICGKAFHSFVENHLDLPHTHGTGCTLAAALAAGIANGLNFEDAARKAHRFTHQALKNSTQWTVPGSNSTISHLNQG